MKLFAFKFNIAFLIVFIVSAPALPGTLNIWVDENGVTHFSNQPPPDNTEHEKIKYKKNTSRSNSDNFEYLRKREAKRNANIRRLESERKDREAKRVREKRDQKSEIDRAKKEYEYLESRKETYRENYHDAYSRSSERYWRDKMKEADEARSKYFKLKNKYGD
jgi:molecular chaperone DnaK (HSP70)